MTIKSMVHVVLTPEQEAYRGPFWPRHMLYGEPTPHCPCDLPAVKRCTFELTWRRRTSPQVAARRATTARYTSAPSSAGR